jgi:hypothetical protein
MLREGGLIPRYEVMGFSVGDLSSTAGESGTGLFLRCLSRGGLFLWIVFFRKYPTLFIFFWLENFCAFCFRFVKSLGAILLNKNVSFRVAVALAADKCPIWSLAPINLADYAQTLCWKAFEAYIVEMGNDPTSVNLSCHECVKSWRKTRQVVSKPDLSCAHQSLERSCSESVGRCVGNGNRDDEASLISIDLISTLWKAEDWVKDLRFGANARIVESHNVAQVWRSRLTWSC